MTVNMSSSTGRFAFWCASIVAAVVLTRSTQAHHSFAMYDQEKQVTLTGKLTRFIPGANHAQLIFEVIGPDADPVVRRGRSTGAGEARPRRRKPRSLVLT